MASQAWLRRVAVEARPNSAAIYAAIEQSIGAGELQPGDRLPPQRRVAEALGVNVGAVNRAYLEAARRGLLKGAVGRGTYVQRSIAQAATNSFDLATFSPAMPPGLDVGAQVAETVAALFRKTTFSDLMTYPFPRNGQALRDLGASWLEPFVGRIPSANVIVLPGGQMGLSATLGALCQPGGTVITEPLVHRGVKILARQLGFKLVACPVDDHGPDPAALAELCATERPAAIFVNPTLSTPLPRTIPLERRRDIARIAKAAGVWIIEDDPFAPLTANPLQTIASLAPEQTFYMSSYSKCLNAGTRFGYLVPPAPWVDRLRDAVDGSGVAPSPLITAVIEQWTYDGFLASLIKGVRAEAVSRQKLAQSILPTAIGAAGASHVWLPLDSSRASHRVRLLGGERGVMMMSDESFSVGPHAPAGLRLVLGGPPTHASLEQALRIVHDLSETSEVRFSAAMT